MPPSCWKVTTAIASITISTIPKLHRIRCRMVHCFTRTPLTFWLGLDAEVDLGRLHCLGIEGSEGLTGRRICPTAHCREFYIDRRSGWRSVWRLPPKGL